MLCQICGRNLASVFLCKDDMSVDVCESCYREEMRGAESAMPDVAGETCYYCGGPARAITKNDGIETLVRRKPFLATCVRCGQLEMLVRDEMEKHHGSLSEVQADQLRDLVVELDRRVLEKVKSPGQAR